MQRERANERASSRVCIWWMVSAGTHESALWTHFAFRRSSLWKGERLKADFYIVSIGFPLLVIFCDCRRISGDAVTMHLWRSSEGAKQHWQAFDDLVNKNENGSVNISDSLKKETRSNVSSHSTGPKEHQTTCGSTRSKTTYRFAIISSFDRLAPKSGPGEQNDLLRNRSTWQRYSAATRSGQQHWTAGREIILDR